MGEYVDIYLDNIGIIKDSHIKLNGLTVITGHNNSGKTTVGKVLYAILSAVENIEQEANRDMCRFAEAELDKIRNKFKYQDNFLIDFWFEEKKILSEIDNLNFLNAFFNSRIDYQFQTVQTALGFIEHLKKEVARVSETELAAIIKNESNEKQQNTRTVKKKQLMDALDRIIFALSYDSELIAYANKKIIDSLWQEFNSQILPVKKLNVSGRIKYWDKEKQCFDVFIVENGISDSNKKAYYSKSFDDVTFVDDVFVIDHMYESKLEDEKRKKGYRHYSWNQQERNSWKDFSRNESHQEDLLHKLIEHNTNLFEEMLNEKKANDLFSKINDVFPEEIELGERSYICRESKLDVKNLAAGSKMFAIIKKLIENGSVQEGSLLILDEPESHLHPEWQNKLAEIIVLLIKELHPYVLLTTHSPNFLMALETYSQKYDLWEDYVNVYCTEHVKDDYMVKYVDVKSDMVKAYAKLANPLIEIKRIKMSVNDAK